MVQLYVSRPGDKEGPSHALRAFKRVTVPAKSVATVEFELDSSSFEWFDENINMMNSLAGRYVVYYGGSSDIAKLKSFKVDRN